MSEDYLFQLADEAGRPVEYELLDSFIHRETNQSYMIYTDHTCDDEGKIRLYAARFCSDRQGIRLSPIESEEEWDLIETHLTEDFFRDEQE